MKDESLVASWQSFFEENCKSEIETIALEYPENRSLIVDYWDIDKADPKLTETLINQPYKALFNAEEALKNIDAVINLIRYLGHLELFSLMNNFPLHTVSYTFLISSKLRYNGLFMQL